MQVSLAPAAAEGALAPLPDDAQPLWSAWSDFAKAKGASLLPEVELRGSQQTIRQRPGFTTLAMKPPNPLLLSSRAELEGFPALASPLAAVCAPQMIYFCTLLDWAIPGLPRTACIGCGADGRPCGSTRLRSKGFFTRDVAGVSGRDIIVGHGIACDDCKKTFKSWDPLVRHSPRFRFEIAPPRPRGCLHGSHRLL